MATSTVVVISTSGAEFNLPGGHWTAQLVAQSFADSVPGIGSMTSEVTVSGDVQTITFKPRTGTKG